MDVGDGYVTASPCNAASPYNATSPYNGSMDVDVRYDTPLSNGWMLMMMAMKNRNCNTLFLLPMIEAKKEVFWSEEEKLH